MSIRLLSTITFPSGGSCKADPSWHWARGRVHPGQLNRADTKKNYHSANGAVPCCWRYTASTQKEQFNDLGVQLTSMDIFADTDSVPCSTIFSCFLLLQDKQGQKTAEANLCRLSLCSSIRRPCLYPPGRTTSPTLPLLRRWVSASSFTPYTCHLKTPLLAAAISFLLEW